MLALYFDIFYLPGPSNIQAVASFAKFLKNMKYNKDKPDEITILEWLNENNNAYHIKNIVCTLSFKPFLQLVKIVRVLQNDLTQDMPPIIRNMSYDEENFVQKVATDLDILCYKKFDLELALWMINKYLLDENNPLIELFDFKIGLHELKECTEITKNGWLNLKSKTSCFIDQNNSKS